MKISLALLVLLLAAAWAGRPGMSFRSSKVTCCPKGKFSSRRISEDKILEYHYTPPTCTHKAVLVTVPKGTVCVNPEDTWFQKYLRNQKKPNSTSK